MYILVFLLGFIIDKISLFPFFIGCCVGFLVNSNYKNMDKLILGDNSKIINFIKEKEKLWR